MIEETERLNIKIEQLKTMVLYIVETQMTKVRFSHLEWCRDKDQNIDYCSCGARQLNNLMGR